MSSLPVRHLHQFRAGRLIKRQNADGKEILAPDTTKGLIRVILDDEDLVRFQWIERSSAGDAIGDPVIDVVIFPHEATFEKVDRPGGSRVFTLAFPTDASDRNLFFWAQEPSTDRDSDDVDSINNGLNTIVDGMNVEQENPQQSQPQPQPISTSIGADALAAALGNILSGAVPSNPTTSLFQQRQQQPGPPLLQDVLKAENLIPLLRNAPSLVTELSSFLPEQHRSLDHMIQIIHSPQFKHQVEVLSNALASGEIDASHFGLRGVVGRRGGPVAQFLQAIQDQYNTKNGDGGDDTDVNNTM